MRKIHEVVEDIKSILNNIERTEECTGETLVDINELVDEILSIDASKQKIVFTATHNPYLPFFDPGLRFDTYETAEMENRLFILPCSIGEPIFVIPSLVNYKLNKLNHFEENNRVYKQIVCNVVFTKKDYLLNTCDGFCNVRGAEYGKTWFLLESQAAAALQAMQEGEQ